MPQYGWRTQTASRDPGEALRNRLGIGMQTTVFLYLGRLGASYKADLFPLVRLFHDEFVRQGSIPIKLVRRILLPGDSGTIL